MSSVSLPKERVLRHHVLLLARPAHPHRDRAGSASRPPTTAMYGTFMHLAVADPVVQRLVPLVEVRADPGGPQPLVQRARRRRAGRR